MTHHSPQPPLEQPPAGAFRFNADSSKMEYYDGNQWVYLTTNSSKDDSSYGTRGIIFGGYVGPASTQNIDVINIATTGNAVQQGSTGTNQYMSGSSASRTRGVFGGGYASGAQDAIHALIISSGGNAFGFGDLSSNRFGSGGGSDQTRAIFFGGSTGPSTSANGVNLIEYVTFTHTGNAIDFGDLNYGPCLGNSGPLNSPVRAFSCGGTAGPARSNTIEYVHTQTLGNATNFGDISLDVSGTSTGSNAVRGIINLGYSPNGSPSNFVNTIEYITFTTLGNSIDFGDIGSAISSQGGLSSTTRTVFAGAQTSGDAQSNVIEWVTIMTLGNALDFGDLTSVRKSCPTCSNGHGGLG
tara:strand:+ start:552 stop:1613 length:1062 start_codon:yes stop_codon:yes gene_type:complete